MNVPSSPQRPRRCGGVTEGRRVRVWRRHLPHASRIPHGPRDDEQRHHPDPYGNRGARLGTARINGASELNASTEKRTVPLRTEFGRRPETRIPGPFCTEKGISSTPSRPFSPSARITRRCAPSVKLNVSSAMSVGSARSTMGSGLVQIDPDMRHPRAARAFSGHGAAPDISGGPRPSRPAPNRGTGRQAPIFQIQTRFRRKRDRPLPTTTPCVLSASTSRHSTRPQVTACETGRASSGCLGCARTCGLAVSCPPGPPWYSVRVMPQSLLPYVKTRGDTDASGTSTTNDWPNGFPFSRSQGVPRLSSGLWIPTQSGSAKIRGLPFHLNQRSLYSPGPYRSGYNSRTTLAGSQNGVKKAT